MNYVMESENTQGSGIGLRHGASFTAWALHLSVWYGCPINQLLLTYTAAS